MRRLLEKNASSLRTIRHQITLEKQERSPKYSDYYVDRGGTRPITATRDGNLEKKGKNDTCETDIRAEWNNPPEELRVYLRKKVNVDYWCGVELVKKSLLSGPEC